MTTESTTYSHARAKLADLLDRVVDDRETVVIRRRGKQDVALIAYDELRGLQETAYLTASPANARRLRAALAASRRGEGVRVSIPELRRRLGLQESKADKGRRRAR
jgi:antitoxin YefM